MEGLIIPDEAHCSATMLAAGKMLLSWVHQWLLWWKGFVMTVRFFSFHVVARSWRCYFDVSSLWPLASFAFFFVKGKMPHNYLFCNMFLAETPACKRHQIPSCSCENREGSAAEERRVEHFIAAWGVQGEKTALSSSLQTVSSGRLLQLRLAWGGRKASFRLPSNKPSHSGSVPPVLWLFMRLNQWVWALHMSNSASMLAWDPLYFHRSIHPSLQPLVDMHFMHTVRKNICACDLFPSRHAAPPDWSEPHGSVAGCLRFVHIIRRGGASRECFACFHGPHSG